MIHSIAAIFFGLSVTAAVPSVDGQALGELLAKDANLLLLDFRAATEFQDGHLPFAVNLPWGDAERPKSAERLEGLLKAGARPVVLYGLEPLRLSQLAEEVSSKTGGPVMVYPAGIAGWVGYEGGYLEIEWEGLWRMLRSDSPAILDVREAAAFAAGHVPAAIHVPVTPVDAKQLKRGRWAELAQSGNPVVTYCGGLGCGDSRKLALQLARAGFRRVYWFAAGYPEWEERTRCLRD